VKSGTFQSHEASLEVTGVLLVLVSSDSESDNSLPKYLSSFPPEYGRFSHLGRGKQLYANF